jgi:8-oxo-dGTP pyrophosphatase MutT (NUDIX family)
MGHTPHITSYHFASDIEFPLEDSRGARVDGLGWTTHDPLQSNGLVFASNNGGTYGRIFQIGFYTPDGRYARDGMLRAERGGVVDLIVDEQGRFGLQLRDRPQTTKSHEEYAADFDNDTLDIHSVGRLGWETPRGYGDKLKKLADTARREAEEETGLKVVSQKHLLWFCDNTANTVHLTGVFKTQLDMSSSSKAVDEDHEQALSDVTFYTSEELLQLIENGELYCGMTLAAMTAELLRRDIEQKDLIDVFGKKLRKAGKALIQLRVQLREVGITPCDS